MAGRNVSGVCALMMRHITMLHRPGYFILSEYKFCVEGSSTLSLSTECLSFEFETPPIY